MLTGKNSLQAVPFIPEVERDTDNRNPTVFWIHPKNMKGTYKSLELYSRAAQNNNTTNKNRPINATKMFEADVQDFLNFCVKVENYMFSEAYPDLNAKGVLKEITEKDVLRVIVEDIDPQVFQEVQNAASDWSKLDSGKEAYENFQKTLKK